MITGSLPEAQGVAPGAELTSYRVADDKGRSDTWTVAVAIRRAVDDGNQIMCQLLKQDIVTSQFTPKNGWMNLPDAPGLGIELDKDALKTATETFAKINAI